MGLLEKKSSSNIRKKYGRRGFLLVLNKLHDVITVISVDKIFVLSD